MKTYKVSQFAKLINVSIPTLRVWDKKNILNSFRTPTNRRFYTHQQYLDFMGNALEDSKEN